jgi:hypothetical protein
MSFEKSLDDGMSAAIGYVNALFLSPPDGLDGVAFELGGMLVDAYGVVSIEEMLQAHTFSLGLLALFLLGELAKERDMIPSDVLAEIGQSFAARRAGDA